MGKGLHTRFEIFKFLILTIIMLILVICLFYFFVPKEKVNISPVKLELEGVVGYVKLEIKSSNILDVYVDTIDENASKSKKLSSRVCKEINLIMKNLISNRSKNHKPSSLNVIDGIYIKATIGGETYLNIYGAYQNYGLDDLDWLVYKLIKESPIKIKSLENGIKFPKEYETNY